MTITRYTVGIDANHGFFCNEDSTNGGWADWYKATDRIRELEAALRAARPCVFNSRHGNWEEALREVDAALSQVQGERT